MTRLDRYIAAATLSGVLLAATALTLLFSLLEFVEQLSSVGQGNYRLIDDFFYVLLTIPSRVLQVTPVSMLIGCLLSLGALADTSELTALQSLGMSERRIIGSVLALACPIIIALFLIAQFVIPPTQQFAESQRASRLSPSASVRSADSFWGEGNRQYLNVQRFEHGNIPRNINIYAFSPEGRLTSAIRANRAEIRPDGTWLLTGVVRKRVLSSQFQTDHPASLVWHSFLPPNRVQQLLMSPDTMAPVELYLYIRDLSRRHQQASRYEQELWAKIAIPFSIVAMILIAAPFLFGAVRAHGTGQRIVIGVGIGIVFSLVQQIAGRLDLLLDLNPAVIALTPSLLLMALAVYLFLRMHRPRRG
ncbi:MAG: LPS export ABC transporter permease LptG [Proteobacteria bacterium]|nr:LPS export ABC transporter permease LptG [Pseudomonadota bacterium]